ncbi:MAG: DUF1080 domain-containing protein [Pseudomonadota bacterium]
MFYFIRKPITLGVLFALALGVLYVGVKGYKDGAEFGLFRRPGELFLDNNLATNRFGDPEKGLHQLIEYAENSASYQPIFNTKNLDQWSGDPELWRVASGQIIGTVVNPLRDNSFLIHEETVDDFILTLAYKLLPSDTNNNTGIQYRSRIVDASSFIVAGMQADIHHGVSTPLKINFGGLLYDERGPRGIIAKSGQRVWVGKNGLRHVLPLQSSQRNIEASYKLDDWNSVRVIACGRRMIHEINNHITVDVIDDLEERATEGVIALQLHVGDPYSVAFKDLSLSKDIATSGLCESYR